MVKLYLVGLCEVLVVLRAVTWSNGRVKWGPVAYRIGEVLLSAVAVAFGSVSWSAGEVLFGKVKCCFVLVEFGNDCRLANRP